MKSAITTGQKIIISVLLLLLVQFIWVQFSPNEFFLGAEFSFNSILQFLIYTVLAVFLFLGANWARWVWILFFGISGIVAVVGVTMVTSFLDMNHFYVFLIGIEYLFLAALFAFAPALKAHFGALFRK